MCFPIALSSSVAPCSGGGGIAGDVQGPHHDLRDPAEPGGSHLCQLHRLASVRGGEALHRLLQHQQHEVPGGSQTPPHGQGTALSLLEGNVDKKCRQNVILVLAQEVWDSGSGK